MNSLLRRLSKTPARLKEYNEIIRTQEKVGIIEAVDSYVPEFGGIHYIPHREVIKEGRNTTKMRIVYDASAKRVGHPSLNDSLETSPCLLPKMFDVIIGFRSYKYAITSDIKAAFLNIRIAKEDRNYFRFLWVDDVTKSHPEIVIKRFTSVLFGVNSSPFLLNATIATHMKQYLDINETFVIKFSRDLYMDDSITGTQDISEAFDFYIFIKTLMLEGGFDLRKWHSNSSKLREAVREYEELYFGKDPVSSPSLPRGE